MFNRYLKLNKAKTKLLVCAREKLASLSVYLISVIDIFILPFPQTNDFKLILGHFPSCNRSTALDYSVKFTFKICIEVDTLPTILTASPVFKPPSSLSDIIKQASNCFLLTDLSFCMCSQQSS